MDSHQERLAIHTAAGMGWEKSHIPTPQGETIQDTGGAVGVAEEFDPQVTWLEVGEDWLEGEEGSPAALRDGASLFKRSTVLPRATLRGDAPTIAQLREDRYQVLDELGDGGGGDVVLIHDKDIDRKVAMKRLKRELHTPTGMMRFVEEIRTTGALEHPNIVPIHDVGLDEQGQFYFMMKYVQGDTMADVITRLQEGDPDAHATYTYEVRNQIFLKLLQAVQFAHSQGVIHRDIKPANVMLGPYGEVMLMDWGLAKQLRAPTAQATQPLPLFAGVSSQDDAPQERLYETRHNALLGTPAYMSPEQALGKHHLLDERSDIYSLSVLYYEWIGLKHYMSHKTNLQDLLFGILQEEPVLLALQKNPHQPNIPVELCHFVRKGMTKAPAQRFATVAAMIDDLQRVIAGKFDIECPVTFTKRVTHGALHITDRHPLLGFGALLSGAGFLLYGVIAACYHAASGLLGG